MAETPANLPCKFSMPNDPDFKDVVFTVRRFEGIEGLNRLFRFRVEVSSLKGDFDILDMTARGGLLRLALAGQGERFFNGMISRFSQIAVEGEQTIYRLDLVPGQYQQSLGSDCRIFQQFSTVLLLKTILGEDPSFIQNPLKESDFPPREYCVQYRESDFHFLSRIMEEDAIFYFYQHSEKGHLMVLGDSPDQHPQCPGQAQVEFRAVAAGRKEKDEIQEWTLESEMRPGKVVLGDFNFETPDVVLREDVPTVVKKGFFEFIEAYDYPGLFKTAGEGAVQAMLRVGAEESQYLVARGRGDVRAFTAGHTFELQRHPRDDMNQKWLLTSVHHHLDQMGLILKQSETISYHNEFTAIPATVPFLPPRITPKPAIQGPQTAVVVTKGEDDFLVDQFGRVKVKFHWDRREEKDDTCSCFIRVSQNWAGKHWGGVFLPRKGQEVIVEFLEGDPDRPIITGRVYNAVQTPPYDLPANQTQSGIKSRSSPGGDPPNFNEIRFEDKKGHEVLTIHAEKDLSETVEASRSSSVGGADSLTVGKTQTVTIKDGAATFHVDNGDRSVVVKEHNTLHAKGITIESGIEDIELRANTQIHLNAKTEAQLFILDTSNHLLVKSSGEGEFVTGTKIEVRVAGNKITLGSGKVAVEAESEVSLAVGGNKITINSSGITVHAAAGGEVALTANAVVTGTQVKLNA